jgi:hypothetical protein
MISCLIQIGLIDMQIPYRSVSSEVIHTRCSLQVCHSELEARVLEERRVATRDLEARGHAVAAAEAQAESLREALGKLSQVRVSWWIHRCLLPFVAPLASPVELLRIYKRSYICVIAGQSFCGEVTQIRSTFGSDVADRSWVDFGEHEPQLNPNSKFSRGKFVMHVDTAYLQIVLAVVGSFPDPALCLKDAFEYRVFILTCPPL